MPIRLMHVADTHLSRTHAYFLDNWSVFREEMAATRRTSAGGRFPRPGYVGWTLDGRGASHRLIEPERMFVIDASGWTDRNGGTTTTLPPRPLMRRAAE